MKEDIRINKIEICELRKEFSYYKNDNENEISKILQEKNDFIKNNHISYEEIEEGYRITHKVFYYSGSISFAPVKTNDASIKLNVKTDEGLMKLIASMCLENVVQVCEKQTDAFRSNFEKYVKGSQEDIDKKIDNSFLANGIKLLTNKKE